MTKWYQGIAGARGSNPLGVVIHNDAASINATSNFYEKYRSNLQEAENGFAHYYVTNTGTFQWELEINKAWHVANRYGNANYIGIEVSQSGAPGVTGLDDAAFLNQEQNAFKLAAQILKRYGLTPNADTVRLHSEFSATACPWRSNILHGGPAATKQYFISQVAKYMGLIPATQSQQDSIAVDGYFGESSVKKLQQLVGGVIADGVLDGQTHINDDYISAMVSSSPSPINYGINGSLTIKLIQKKVGVTADGYLGKQTVTAIQKAIGTPADGYFGANSAKTWQKLLNEGKLFK